MTTPPDGMVPDEMPEGLERVQAALGSPVDPAPDALLDRIITSRAAGERRILPSDHAPPSRLRVRLVRGAIAAMLGLVALGVWSRWGRAHAPAPSTAVAGFGFPMGGDFGFGEIALAQGGRTVTLATDEPITFDTTRLHAMRLAYVSRSFADGTHPVRLPDTIGVSIARATEIGKPWTITSTNVESGGKVRVRHTDTTVLSAASLRPIRYSMALAAEDGSGQSFSQVFGVDSTTLHREFREVHPRSLTGAQAPRSDTLVTTRDSSYATPPNHWPGVGRGAWVANFMAVPIGRGWSRSWVLATRGDTTISVKIEVVGNQNFDGPKGKIDCWKLVMRGSPGYTILLRKSDGLLVSISGAQTANGKRYGGEMVLIGEQ